MKNSLWVLLVTLLAVPFIGTAAPQQEKGKEGPLPWAYGADAGTGSLFDLEPKNDK